MGLLNMHENEVSSRYFGRGAPKKTMKQFGARGDVLKRLGEHTGANTPGKDTMTKEELEELAKRAAGYVKSLS